MISRVINFRRKIVKKKYFNLGENPAVVTLPLCEDVTTKQFYETILCLKAKKKFQLTFQIFLNMWQTIWPVKLLIFVLKFWSKNTSSPGEIPPWLHCFYATM